MRQHTSKLEETPIYRIGYNLHCKSEINEKIFNFDNNMERIQRNKNNRQKDVFNLSKTLTGKVFRNAILLHICDCLLNIDSEIQS